MNNKNFTTLFILVILSLQFNAIAMDVPADSGAGIGARPGREIRDGESKAAAASAVGSAEAKKDREAAAVAAAEPVMRPADTEPMIYLPKRQKNFLKASLEPAMIIGATGLGVFGLYKTIKSTPGKSLAGIGSCAAVVAVSNFVYRLSLKKKRDLLKKINDQLKKGFCYWRVENCIGNNLPYGYNILASGPELVLEFLAQDLVNGEIISITKRQRTGSQTNGQSLVHYKDVKGRPTPYLRKETLLSIKEDIDAELKILDELRKNFKDLEKIIIEIAENFRKDFAYFLQTEADVFAKNGVEQSNLINPQSIKINKLDFLAIFGNHHITGRELNGNLLQVTNSQTGILKLLDSLQDSYEKKCSAELDKEKVGVERFKEIIGKILTCNYFFNLNSGDFEKVEKDLQDTVFKFAFRYARLKLIGNMVNALYMQMEGKDAVKKGQQDAEKGMPEGVKIIKDIVEKIQAARKAQYNILDIERMQVLLANAIAKLTADFSGKANNDSADNFGQFHQMMNVQGFSLQIKKLNEANRKLISVADESMKNGRVIANTKSIDEAFDLIEEVHLAIKDLRLKLL